MKFTNAIVLLFVALACAVATPAASSNSAATSLTNAQTKLNNAMTTVGNTAGQVSGTLNQVSQFLDTLPGRTQKVVDATEVQATAIADSLKELRETANVKFDEIDALLNKTSTSEKAVVEKGFAVIEQILEQIDEYTGIEINNEYDAASVSDFIQAKITQANTLLSDLRKYLNKYIDTATEQIHTIVPAVTDAAGTIAEHVTEAASTLKNLADLIDAKKLEYDFDFKNPNYSELIDIIGTIDLEKQYNYAEILAAIESLGLTGTSLTDALLEITDTLPESEAKDKISKILNSIAEAIEKGTDVVNKGLETAKNVAQTAQNVVKTAKNLYDTGKNVWNDIKEIF